mmetsp:Transcript_34149/g.93912  ORF Transcript_34149/g.93912 Transcript_34149/m.93912 type:complete len:530 (-) Transcript_34149:392-1981(-)
MASNIQRIGHYRLGKNLGIGSFGKVRLAEHQLTGHKVAIKILNRNRIRQLDMDEKVRREIKILKLFYHPHIIRLYEVIYTPTDIYMVMEFVPGGELFDFIVSNGRLSEPRARVMFQQLISGVEYCHQHMVVHRDLKPENLLLDADQQLRIADFGLSNVMKDGDFFKTSCGSPNYAAPEVISGKLYAGPEVDVWSCGVILYALLCGSLPFDDENIPNLFKKIKGGIFTLPGHMSDDIKDLISRMLVVDPLQRITIPEIRKHRWFVVSLPLYLSVTPDQIMSQFRAIDHEVLTEVVMKIGFERQELLLALQQQERNQMTVAYYLILDHKRRKMLGSSPIMHATQQLAQQQPPAAAAPGVALDAAQQQVQAQQAQAHQAAQQAVQQAQQAAAAQQQQQAMQVVPSPQGQPGPSRVPAPEKRWQLGVVSFLPPADMMLEIFRALRALQFEWKIVAQYSLKCRPCTRPPMGASDGSHSMIDPSGMAVRCKVKVGLNLYKIPQQEEQYLLDIRKVDGEVLPFMDVCSLLLSELKL